MCRLPIQHYCVRHCSLNASVALALHMFCFMKCVLITLWVIATILIGFMVKTLTSKLCMISEGCALL